MSNIQGIEINGITKKVAQFADDLWAPSKLNRLSFDSLLHEFQLFASYSGMNINYNKTTIMRVTSLQYAKAQYYSRLPLVWSDGPNTVLGIVIHKEVSIMTELIYRNISIKAQNIASIRSARSLTLLGKIQVWNTLISSLFVYRLQCLPSPSKQIYAEYDKILTAFLWDGKKSKIKRLIRNFKEGGLKLMDLATKNASLKIAWVFKLIRTPVTFWTSIAHYFLPTNDALVWDCNLTSKDIVKTYSTSFWIDVLRAWSEIHFKILENVLDIKNQVIWCNSNIKIKRTMLCNKRLIALRLFKVEHVYNELENRFMTFQELINNYGNIMDFVTYFGILKVIPVDWKNILPANANCVQSKTIFDLFPEGCKHVSTAYWLLISRIPQITDSKKLMWEMELKIKIPDSSWSKIYSEILKITISTKLRYFHYRCVYRLITTNVHRCRWDPTITNLCTFCTNTSETTIHLFFECEYVSKIWKLLSRWLKNFCNIKLNFCKSNVLLNNYTGSYQMLINVLILITKQYI